MNAPSPSTIDPAQLRSMLSDGGEVAIVDVREEGVFERGHILVAANLPLSTFELRIDGLFPRRSARIVLVDDDDGLSIRAASLLAKAGFTNVSSLGGGLGSWVRAGHRVFSGLNVPSKAFGEAVERLLGTPSIDAPTLAAWRRDGKDMVVLDSRPVDEFRGRSLPDGLNCPGAELLARAPLVAPSPATTIVVNCAGRTRSIIGAQSLIDASLPNPVVALRNGVMGWRLAGFDVEAGADRLVGPPPMQVLAVASERARAVAERWGVRYVDEARLAEFKAAPDRTTYVFDVRLPEDYAAGHRNDAVNAPGGQLVQATDLYVPVRGARLVLVDADDVQAPMTAHWLARMGWDAFVLRADPANATLERGVPAVLPSLPPEFLARSVPVEDLRARPGPVTIVDVGDSRVYRKARLPGSWFAIRSRLAACLGRAPSHLPFVFVCADGALSRYAASDAIALGHRDASFLEGGRRAWSAAGGPTEVAPASCLLTEADDVWYRPYDPGVELEASMRAYLAWEMDLIHRALNEPGIAFDIAPAPDGGAGKRSKLMTADSRTLLAETVARRKRFMSASVDSLQIYHDDPLVLTRGEGQYVFDHAGRRYLDATAQNLCISVGFSHPLTSRMVAEQVSRLAHCTTLFHNETASRYAEELIGRMPAGDWVVHLLNSGAEAIDLAYAMAREATGALEILYLRNAYHGLQFTAAATTAFSIGRSGAPAPGFVQVIHPDAYRGAFGPDVAPYLDEISQTIGSNTCGRIAGMVVEPIQGFGGVVPMPKGYIAAAAERVRAAGGLMIIDEVQTGFGRTGSHFWAFEAEGIAPDLVVLGKGMGNGLPISGVIARRDIAETFARRAFFNTFGGNPVAAAAARSVLMAIEQEQLQGAVARTGERLSSGLRALQARYDMIGDVRGAGLIVGVELVTDRRAKTPATEASGRIHKALRQSGVIAVRGTPRRNVFRFNPPFCVTADDVDHVLSAFEDALKDA